MTVVSNAAIDAQIIAVAQELDAVAEACHYVDYDPNLGRVPEHWVPRHWVRAIAKHAYAAGMAAAKEQA